MTLVEFNEKYEDYCPQGNYGLAIDRPKVIEFLDDVFEDLIKIEGFEYYQIKTKFTDTDVRFYSNLGFPLNGAIECKIARIIEQE